MSTQGVLGSALEQQREHRDGHMDVDAVRCPMKHRSQPEVSRPRVSDVVNQTAKFTIDTLVEMLSRVGTPARLAVGGSGWGSII